MTSATDQTLLHTHTTSTTWTSTSASITTSIQTNTQSRRLDPRSFHQSTLHIIQMALCCLFSLQCARCDLEFTLSNYPEFALQSRQPPACWMEHMHTTISFQFPSCFQSTYIKPTKLNQNFDGCFCCLKCLGLFGCIPYEGISNMRKATKLTAQHKFTICF